MWVKPLIAVTSPEMRVAASWISEASPRTEQAAAVQRSAPLSAGPLTTAAIRSSAAIVTGVSPSGPAMPASTP